MPTDVATFTIRWQQSSASERSNYALFLSELCDLLDLPRPDPSQADDSTNIYVIDKVVHLSNLDGTTTPNYIDLYRQRCFILEAKQGSNLPAANPLQATRRLRRGTALRNTPGWDEAMLAARAQAERYAKALPASEGWPPFLIVVDIGHSIELYADFSLTGKAYLPFPDPRSFRILLQQLAEPEIQARLRTVWLDPLSLDPSRLTAKVTREVAAKLANLARNLELQHSPKEVAEFLTRCIFTSFSEDVGLLPERSWLNLLESLRADVTNFPNVAQSLWQSMNDGGFSPILRSQVLKFNGGLFQSTTALPLNLDQLNMLIEAADSRWRDVEPAIFGTLLERALDANERHALGAHYTPRAYVERLVIPTLVEPLRDDWRNALAVITRHVNTGDISAAIETGRAFHRQLCDTRVLDPACGSGNFLYVALEHMKRLEGEVLETLYSLGDTQQALEHTGLTVDPHQLLGIELNPRAAVIADLVLWIGYLQWHFRTHRNAQPPIPVIRNFRNIVEADALISHDQKITAVNETGGPLTEWDRVTFKQSALTGRKIPDLSAQRSVFAYPNVTKTEWPAAEFIVGNPPFIGKGKMLKDLGEGYVNALRSAYHGEVPDGSDFVMYWWQKGASRVASGDARRSGLISTNSITQVFNSRVVANAMQDDPRTHLVFAIPDHPWIDSKNGAAIRIAMTVLAKGIGEGTLALVTDERPSQEEEGILDVSLHTQVGLIHRNLTAGVNVTLATPLTANAKLSGTGLILGSRGFVLSSDEAQQYHSNDISKNIVHPLYTGTDVTDGFRGTWVIDTVGLSSEHFRELWPELYQLVLDRVAPDRDANRDARLQSNWWLFRRSNQQVRAAMRGLTRYIVTPETSKHRFFVFLPNDVRPEHGLVVVGSQDAFHLGILSSSIHMTWTSHAGGTLEDRPRYNKTVCFDPFPFPVCAESQKQIIRIIAEHLDAHRKRQQQLHPTLTLTDMYNVLDKLRSGADLPDSDRAIYNDGLVSILRELHDELDRAVFAAYGWPHDLTTEQVLARVVALNVERRAEEASGLVRWLRPEYQAPNAAPIQAALSGLIPTEAPAARRKLPWPATLTDQVRAIKDALRAIPFQTPQQLASGFKPASRTRVSEILETLTALGQTRQVNDKYLL